MDIEQIINIIKVRPAMFIGELNINNLKNFISGSLFNNLICDRKYPMDIVFDKDFHNWVKVKIGERMKIKFDSGRGYDYCIKEVCENGEQEVALFFELCEDFFEEMRNRNYKLD